MERDKLEKLLEKEFNKEDQSIEHPFAWYVSGVAKGLEIANAFLFLKDEDEKK